jgi:hypothetical protein
LVSPNFPATGRTFVSSMMGKREMPNGGIRMANPADDMHSEVQG